jgi:hypothetical protein
MGLVRATRAFAFINASNVGVESWTFVQGTALKEIEH